MKVDWLSVLAVIPLVSAIDRIDTSRSLRLRRALGDRMSQFDTNELDCQLGMRHSWGTEMRGQLITYYYALGYRSGFDQAQMDLLETKLFYQAMNGGMTWCTRPMDEQEALARESDGARRHLTAQFSQKSRGLNVVSVNSGASDAPLDSKFCREQLKQ